MERSKLIQFLSVQLIRPTGLLIQFAVLARFLGPEGFSRFAFLYSLTILLSILSDLGQRQIAFANMRTAADAATRCRVVTEARRIKTLGSLLLGAVLVAAIALEQLTEIEALGVFLVSVTMPIADVSAALLRGHANPRPEMIWGTVEQGLLLAALWCMPLLYAPLTASGALLAFGSIGVLRGIGLYIVVQRHFGPAREASPETKGVTSVFGALLRRSLITSLSLVASVGMARLPALLFPGYMTEIDYSVFIAFWTLFQRGELVLGAVIQAGFKRAAAGRIGSLVANPAKVALLALGLGGMVVAVTLPFAQQLTQIYLGPRFAVGARFALFAALLIPLHLPVFALRTLMQFADAGFQVVYVLLPAIFVVGIACVVLPSGGGLVPVIVYGVSLIVCGVLLFNLNKRLSSA